MARLFKYGDRTAKDPGPQYTVEQVKASLIPFFPELAVSTHRERTLDNGDVEITFQKQTTTKGADTDLLVEAGAQGRDAGDVIAMWQQLQAVPTTEDPLESLAQAGTIRPEMTVDELRAVWPGVQACFEETVAGRILAQEVARQCLTIQPAQTDAFLPLGF
jgi:hypothetical protein